MEEIKYWYPICGHKSGWCLGDDGCKPINDEGKPTIRYLDCSLAVEKHPLTGNKPNIGRSKK